MHLDLGLLADDATKDAADKLYIWGEFRYIFAASVPAVHPRLAIVLRFTATSVEFRSRGQHLLAMELVNMDGQPVFGMECSPTFPMSFKEVGPASRGMMMSQIIIRLVNLPLPAFGDYSVHFLVNGEHRGVVSFHVLPLPGRTLEQARDE